jgi:parallel beta helix pectate lyase-like protein
MNARRLFAGLGVWVLSISPALALANRVFVSARSGNNANSCDNIATPCQSFAGAVTQLNPDGEVIVLDSGGYGPVTITQGVTIEAPAGVTAFVHPPSGDAITVNAGSGTVTLRGLTLNGGASNGITVNSAGTLNVENCFITGFIGNGIQMNAAGRLNVKGTDIKACGFGVEIANTAGVVQASIDHCHLDGNTIGFAAQTTDPGSSTTTASYTTANNNSGFGWRCGNAISTGKDVLNLEFCAGSENDFIGLVGASANALSVGRYSNCVFANNGGFGVERIAPATVETRGNNTITGNGTAATNGVIGTFSPM